MPDVGFDGYQIGAVFGGEKGSLPAGFADGCPDADEVESDLLLVAGGVFDALGEGFRDVDEVPAAWAFVAPDLALYLERFHGGILALSREKESAER